MTSPRIDIVAGARPNFMKVAPIIRALRERAAAGGTLGYRLVHTGQHYDQRMSGDFFAQLEIPEPDVNLEVGSGSHAEQTGRVMIAYEGLLATDRPAGLSDELLTMAGRCVTGSSSAIDVEPPPSRFSAFQTL